jgi:alpha-tubulin suppressor-like RCC1 family protein
MSIGDGHVCAVDAAHDVYCWGWNVSGQAGPGPTGQEAYRLKQSHRVTPARVALPSGNFVAVAAARYSTCALGRKGEAFCWGGNHDGVLGSGLLPEEPGSPDGTTPVRVVGLDDATAISAGSEIACALRRGAATESRTVACWGSNDLFGLGRGTRRELPAPGRRGGSRPLGEPAPGPVAAPLADRPPTTPTSP